MGKATRWFKGLLGIKKGKENEDDSSHGGKKEKKRWSSDKSGKDSLAGVGQIPVQIPATDSAWLRTYIAQTEKDQNKHAIAVAAATAAAADAAVAAAHAAAAVVRLTSQGSGVLFNGATESSAAVKIQAVFRGYLARKALRALKGLVKLQALVRGYLVRKRATAMLHSMQALIRAQAAVRSQRSRRSINKDHRLQPETRPRKAVERFDESRSEFPSKRLSASYDTNGFDDSPKIVEIDTFKPKSRSRIINACMSDVGDDVHPFYSNISSPRQCPIPVQISTPDCRHFQDYEWSFSGEQCGFSAQSTPRFASCGLSVAPPTPSKSACGDSFLRPYWKYPSYMANTQSFSAKLRSHSAPKQRPESGPRKSISLNEIMASRSSFSGVKMHRSSQGQ